MYRWRRPKPGPSLPGVAADVDGHLKGILCRPDSLWAYDTLWTKLWDTGGQQTLAGCSEPLYRSWNHHLKNHLLICCNILNVDSRLACAHWMWNWVYLFCPTKHHKTIVEICANTPCRTHTLLDLGRSTKVLGNIKFHPRKSLDSIGKINKGIRAYKSPTPGKLYIQLGRSTKVWGHIKVPPLENFTFNWEDQQR